MKLRHYSGGKCHSMKGFLSRAISARQLGGIPSIAPTEKGSNGQTKQCDKAGGILTALQSSHPTGKGKDLDNAYILCGNSSSQDPSTETGPEQFVDTVCSYMYLYMYYCEPHNF